MHVIIGGAHNGKREFVGKLLSDPDAWTWVGEGHEEDLDSIKGKDAESIVIDGVEGWLEQTELDEEAAIQHILEVTEGRNVICILTDIGRGIVPMDKGQRELRDACGRLYQRLMEQADEVTRIWYGLAQTIKKRGEAQ